MAIVTVAVQAGGAATVTCGTAPMGVYNNGQLPMLNINYTPSGGISAPGLFWVGVLNPDRDKGTFLAPDGWKAYQGGQTPSQARYDADFPSSIMLTIPFPTDGRFDTAGWIGYGIYAYLGVSQNLDKKLVPLLTVPYIDCALQN